MAASAQLTAARGPSGPPPAREPGGPGGGGRPAPRVDEELLRVLDWATPLPDALPEAPADGPSTA
ncbi:hypothetical protein [Streptacidiphilus melanogenes]|uniref:hypothetical protein n=1 Tax=Streptacidiphilus melanogenes TaxID=411235 RepID=UPI00126A099F|nr:hypothetical protein [Streptacidiphilus melanogenes]